MNLKDFQASLRKSLKRFLMEEEEIERKYRVNNLDVVIHLQKSNLKLSLSSNLLQPTPSPTTRPHRICVTCEENEEIRKAITEIFHQNENQRFIFKTSLIEEEFEPIFRKPQKIEPESPKSSSHFSRCEIL